MILGDSTLISMRSQKKKLINTACCLTFYLEKINSDIYYAQAIMIRYMCVGIVCFVEDLLEIDQITLI